MRLRRRPRLLILLCSSVGFLTTQSHLFAEVPEKKSGSTVSCVSLGELVAGAMTRSESLMAQQSDALIAAEQYEAAKAAVKPTIKATASILKQDQSKSEGRANDEEFPTTAKLTLSQPVFAGGAEYAALRKTEKLAAQGAKLNDSARIKVARDVVSKAFQVLIAQAELKSTAELRDLSRRRLKNIQGRVAIGRSKSADGLGADAQAANSDAQFEASRLALDSAVRQLASMTGKVVQTVCEPASKPKLAIKTWDEILAKISQRPDIQAANMSLSMANESVMIARAGHFPSIELGGNYYLKRPESQRTYGNWDVTLSASVPIYSGGMVSAKVSEAVASEQKQQAMTAQLKRLAEDEARDLWELVEAGQTQLTSLDEAAKKSSQYYQVMASDERKGLASSLETLQVLNAFIDSQRAAQKSKYKFDENVRQLHLVVGDFEGALR